MAIARSQTVYVRVPAKIGKDLKKMEELNRRVLGELGHPQCYSGFDIRYLHEREILFNVDAEMNIKAGKM